MKEELFLEKAIKEMRQWGNFKHYPLSGASAVKILEVRPGKALSLQYHNRRSEFWFVLDAGLEITLNDRIWKPLPGEEIFIPPKAVHRVRCTGDKPARFMEIWFGDSNEEDIVRLRDEYGWE